MHVHTEYGAPDPDGVLLLCGMSSMHAHVVSVYVEYEYACCIVPRMDLPIQTEYFRSMRLRCMYAYAWCTYAGVHMQSVCIPRMEPRIQAEYSRSVEVRCIYV